MPPRRITQKEIAQKAGLTQAAVSLALSGHPGIPQATRERVLEAAQSLGYRPDPYLSGLAAYRKSVRPAKFQATLAWLCNDTDGSHLANSPIFRRYFEGAAARAGELGYRLEPYHLLAPGMTPERLAGILSSRNTPGILISPQPRPNLCLEFPFERFSAVTFGYTLAEPRLHMTTLHQHRTVEKAFRRLLTLGYRRPGLAIPDDSDQRANRIWSAAFWSEQRMLPASGRVPLLLAKHYNKEALLKWVARHRPDVVLTICAETYRWLREGGISVPGEMGLALLSIPDEDHFYSGIWENPHTIGSRAVDFLVSLIHRGERGIPTVPICQLVDGTWLEGKTVRSPKDGMQGGKPPCRGAGAEPRKPKTKARRGLNRPGVA